MQNGVTAADIAEASGHEDLSKELMTHSLSQQDVRHNDDVSYHCRLYMCLGCSNCSSRLATLARGLYLVQAVHCMCTIMPSLSYCSRLRKAKEKQESFRRLTFSTH